MKEFWDARYREEGFAYGSEPNAFVKDQLNAIAPQGRILFPAEGDGRNAVYAAGLGWDVHAYDISEGGREKAMLLAQARGVRIDYRIAGFLEVEYPAGFFDALVLSYVHVPTALKASVLHTQKTFLKEGGLLIFEGFSVNNLPLRAANPQIGGPDNVDMLYSVEEIANLFEGVPNLRVWEEEVELSEGKYHVGKAIVIRADNSL
jgi:hypothetical protein